MCTTPKNVIYLALKTPLLYTYVGKRWAMSDLAVMSQTDPSPAPTRWPIPTDLMM